MAGAPRGREEKEEIVGVRFQKWPEAEKVRNVFQHCLIFCNRDHGDSAKMREQLRNEGVPGVRGTRFRPPSVHSHARENPELRNNSY